MSLAIGEILLLAVGVAISPLPIMPVVLLLGTSRARVNGPAYVLGWLLGLSLVGAVTLLIAPELDEAGPATWVSVAKLVLGLALVALAVKQWRGRPRGDDAEVSVPSWLGAIETFTPPKALGTGVLLAANPKNLVLVLAAAASIVEAELPGAEQAVSYAVFTLIGSLGVAIPVVMFFALGDRAPALLARLNAWLARNTTLIMVAILLLIGVKLIGDAVGGLSS